LYAASYMVWPRHRWAYALSTLAALLAWGALTAGSHRQVRTEDQNHDGRPDVWRVYDERGQLQSAAFDTNFDGRSDVQEYYQRGRLVRREADRDFNDRVDLLQEFDSVTQESTRAVIDVDFDGTADVLTIFRDGQPIVTQTAAAVGRHVDSAPPRSGNQRLAALDDPFLAHPSLRGLHALDTLGDSLELPGRAMLLVRFDVVDPRVCLATIADAEARAVRHAWISHASPRAPPATA